MTVRFSDEASRLLAGDTGLRRAIANCRLEYYTGSQPASANNAIGSATPIITYTDNNGVYTGETLPVWKISISAASAGATITSVKIGGIEILGVAVADNDLDTLGALAAAQINQWVGNMGFTASYDAPNDDIIITGPIGVGTILNTLVCTATAANVTATPDTAGAATTPGVDAVNGLVFDYPKDGADLATPADVFYIEKAAGDVWKGENGYDDQGVLHSGIVDGNTYTAGWGRIYGTPGDDGSVVADESNRFVRVDFSIGVSAADIIMSPAATFFINTTTPVESAINSFRLRVNKNMA